LVALLAASASAQETQDVPEERERRVRILANALYNPTSVDFSDTVTFPSYLEEGSTTTSYEGGKGVVFEVGAIVKIREPFGVMGSLEVYQSDFDSVYEQSLPHPLYFERPRTVGGDLPGLEYSETAVHLDAVFTRELPRFTIDLFAGPSFFMTSIEVLDSVETTSEYPFDEAVVRSTTTRKLEDSPIGFNAGGSLTWKLNDVFGIAFQARYSRATIGISREGSEEIELDAGGFRVGGGVRVSF
jgi:hypothetical protein